MAREMAGSETPDAAASGRARRRVEIEKTVKVYWPR
jgi:hypothetical protein